MKLKRPLRNLKIVKLSKNNSEFFDMNKMPTISYNKNADDNFLNQYTNQEFSAKMQLIKFLFNQLKHDENIIYIKTDDSEKIIKTMENNEFYDFFVIEGPSKNKLYKKLIDNKSKQMEYLGKITIDGFPVGDYNEKETQKLNDVTGSIVTASSNFVDNNVTEFSFGGYVVKSVFDEEENKTFYEVYIKSKNEQKEKVLEESLKNKHFLKKLSLYTPYSLLETYKERRDSKSIVRLPSIATDKQIEAITNYFPQDNPSIKDSLSYDTLKQNSNKLTY